MASKMADSSPWTKATMKSGRFSYEELRQLLIECMQLESKIIQFQDQLEIYRRAGYAQFKP